jgi:hypothetical protein
MSNERLTSCQRLSIAELRTAAPCQTVKMPRRDGGQGLRRLCNYGRGTLGTAMSNNTLAKLVALTIALIAAIVWLGAERHVGCKVNCPTDILAQHR